MILNRGVDFFASDERYITGNEERASRPIRVDDVVAGFDDCTGKIVGPISVQFHLVSTCKSTGLGRSGDDHDAF